MGESTFWGVLCFVLTLDLQSIGFPLDSQKKYHIIMETDLCYAHVLNRSLVHHYFSPISYYNVDYLGNGMLTIL